MSATPERPPCTIGHAEGWSLRLVFGGPVSLWVPLARFVGVKVDAATGVDAARLADAEVGAWIAGRRFGAGLVATTVCTVGLFMWIPIQTRLTESFTHAGFHSIAGGVLDGGWPFWTAIAIASTATLVVGLAAGLLNAVVFGGIPLVLLRRCTLAAAPAVSIAMTQGDDAFSKEQAAIYPRVAFAAEHILHPGRRIPR